MQLVQLSSGSSEILNENSPYNILVWILVVVGEIPLCPPSFVRVVLPGVLKELCDIGEPWITILYVILYPSSTSSSVERILQYWRDMNHGLFYPLPFVRVGPPGVLKELCEVVEPWTMVSFIHYLLSELDLQEYWRNYEVGEPWTMFSFIHYLLSELNF